MLARDFSIARKMFNEGPNVPNQCRYLAEEEGNLIGPRIQPQA